MPIIHKTKVLIVDDERTIANSLALVLDLEGFTTRTAYSGEEGLQLAHAFRPDILISDVFMRGITGLETALELKARIPCCDILLMSGDTLKAKELLVGIDGGGGIEILAKPVHPLDLLVRLRGLARSFENKGMDYER